MKVAWLLALVLPAVVAGVWVQVEPVLEPVSAPRFATEKAAVVPSSGQLPEDFQYQIAALQAQLAGKPAPAKTHKPKVTKKPNKSPKPKKSGKPKKTKKAKSKNKNKKPKSKKNTPKKTSKAKKPNKSNKPKKTKKPSKTGKPNKTHQPHSSKKPHAQAVAQANNQPQSLDAMMKEFDDLNRQLHSQLSPKADAPAASAAAPAASAAVASKPVASVATAVNAAVSAVASAVPAPAQVQFVHTDPQMLGPQADVSTAIADPANVDPHHLSLSPQTTPSAVGMAVREAQAVTYVPRTDAPSEEIHLSEGAKLSPQPWVSAKMDLGSASPLPSNAISMPARLPVPYTQATSLASVAAPLSVAPALALLEVDEQRVERSNEHTVVASHPGELAVSA
jgi:hypothetical protein